MLLASFSSGLSWCFCITSPNPTLMISSTRLATSMDVGFVLYIQSIIIINLYPLFLLFEVNCNVTLAKIFYKAISLTIYDTNLSYRFFLFLFSVTYSVTIVCACEWVTSDIPSHLSHTHEICSLQTLQNETGVRWDPHDLQDSLLYIMV
jgi:hypothetical protein